eukprot:367158_1
MAMAVDDIFAKDYDDDIPVVDTVSFHDDSFDANYNVIMQQIFNVNAYDGYPAKGKMMKQMKKEPMMEMGMMKQMNDKLQENEGYVHETAGAPLQDEAVHNERQYELGYEPMMDIDDTSFVGEPDKPQKPQPSMQNMSNQFTNKNTSVVMYPPKNGPIAIAKRLNIPIHKIPDIDPHDEILGDPITNNSLTLKYAQELAHLTMMGFSDVTLNLRYLSRLNDLTKVIEQLTTPSRYKGIYIGDRVVRGPDWKWGDQDGGDGLEGTVYGLRRWHPKDGPMKQVTAVIVMWDHGLYGNYRYGYYSAYDISIIRRYTNHDTINENKPIEMGQKVERNSREWRHGRQDGNGYGSVIELYASPAPLDCGCRVAVLWDHERTKYKDKAIEYCKLHPNGDEEWKLHDDEVHNAENDAKIDTVHRFRLHVDPHRARVSVNHLQWVEPDFEELLSKPIPKYRWCIEDRSTAEQICCDLEIQDVKDIAQRQYLMPGDLVRKGVRFPSTETSRGDSSIVLKVEQSDPARVQPDAIVGDKIYTTWSDHQSYLFGEQPQEIVWYKRGEVFQHRGSHIKVGDRVRRGISWNYFKNRDEDGGNNAKGTVVGLQAVLQSPGILARVQWEKTGHENYYQWGFKGFYDIKSVEKEYDEQMDDVKQTEGGHDYTMNISYREQPMPFTLPNDMNMWNEQTLVEVESNTKRQFSIPPNDKIYIHSFHGDRILSIDDIKNEFNLNGGYLLDFRIVVIQNIIKEDEKEDINKTDAGHHGAFVDILLKYNKQIYPFHASSALSILEFKKMVESTYKLPPHLQVLRKTDLNGVHYALLDERYLYEYIHGDTSIIELFVYKKSDISLTIASKRVTFNIDDTISTLTQYIHSAIPEQYLRFVHPEKYMALRMTDTFKMHCFMDGDTIQIADMRIKSDPIKVSITSAQTIALDTHQHCRILDVKAAIEKDAGIPIEAQRIIMAGTELNNESFLFDYGIQNNSVLHLICRSNDEGKDENDGVLLMLQEPIRIPRGLAKGLVAPIVKEVQKQLQYNVQKETAGRPLECESYVQRETPGRLLECGDNDQKAAERLPKCKFRVQQFWDKKILKFRFDANSNIKYENLIKLISEATQSDPNHITLSVNEELLTKYENVQKYDGELLVVERCDMEQSKILKLCMVAIVNKETTTHIGVNVHFTVKRLRSEYVSTTAKQLSLNMADVEEDNALRRAKSLYLLSQLQKSHFLFRGHYMNDDKLLEYYGIGSESVVDVVTNESGGNSLRYTQWLKSYENDEMISINSTSPTKPNAKPFNLFSSISSVFSGIIGASASEHKSNEDEQKVPPYEKYIVAERFNSYLNNHSKIDPDRLQQALRYEENHDIIKQCKETEKKYYGKIQDCGLLSMYLWTTNVLYKTLNSALESNDLIQLKIWKPYLYYLSFALRSLPYFYGKIVFRGINGIQDISCYRKGNTISFRRVTATSMDYRRALDFAMRKPAHLMFEIFCVDGRDISGISKFSTEKEVLFLPHSHFKIVDVQIIALKKYRQLHESEEENQSVDEEIEEQNPINSHKNQRQLQVQPIRQLWRCSVCSFENSFQAAICLVCQRGQNPNAMSLYGDQSAAVEQDTEEKKEDSLPEPGSIVLIKLKQIQTPRSDQVIVWVDDEPQNNMKYVYELEKQNISVIICTSTQEAEMMLTHYQWILSMENGDIRIVTDMVRVEGNERKYDAGVHLIQLLRNKYSFTHKILIFCGDVRKAKNKCIESNLVENVYVTVSSKVLRSFVAFDDNIDSYMLAVRK